MDGGSPRYLSQASFSQALMSPLATGTPLESPVSNPQTTGHHLQASFSQALMSPLPTGTPIASSVSNPHPSGNHHLPSSFSQALMSPLPTGPPIKSSVSNPLPPANHLQASFSQALISPLATVSTFPNPQPQQRTLEIPLHPRNSEITQSSRSLAIPQHCQQQNIDVKPVLPPLIPVTIAADQFPAFETGGRRGDVKLPFGGHFTSAANHAFRRVSPEFSASVAQYPVSYGSDYFRSNSADFSSSSTRSTPDSGISSQEQYQQQSPMLGYKPSSDYTFGKMTDFPVATSSTGSEFIMNRSLNSPDFPANPAAPGSFQGGHDSFQVTSPSSPDSTNSGPTRPGVAPTAGQKRKGTPYIPSYMDLTNGPEPCVVCGDAATGYHYRCMTCEGCKGFFRRTIQKNLTYHCKWSGDCVIDKTTRNQCQQCRYTKCLAVGMATDLVLNEKQRVAKRKLIEDNRQKRRHDSVGATSPGHVHCGHDTLTSEDRALIDDVVLAYEQTANKSVSQSELKERSVEVESLAGNAEMWQQLAEVLTPSIIKVVDFAKRVPGFLKLAVDDQILLLKSCCMEIMCLRAACRYNTEDESLSLQNGVKLTRAQINTNTGLGLLVEPIFEFAVGLSKLQLDNTEIALLAAVLLMQSDRSGLKEPEHVERIQDAILGAYKRYIAEHRPSQPVHWAKVLMKVTDLRSISTRHAERVLCVKLDSPQNLPPLFLEMFDESGTKPLPKTASGDIA